MRRGDANGPGMGSLPAGARGFGRTADRARRCGAAASAWRPTADRPLAGLKVLDLTRVLAGPVATRFLAGYGADVLRIDPPDWSEPAIEPEVTLGKRCAQLDLRQAADRARFERLLGEADLFVHGYRPDALDALGLSETARRALNPGLIDVRLDAYGWTGPWRNRRGFDSLVQMSTGIAAAGMAWRGAQSRFRCRCRRSTTRPAISGGGGHPRPDGRLAEGRATSAKLSLARTAALLVAARGDPPEATALTPTDADYARASRRRTGDRLSAPALPSPSPARRSSGPDLPVASARRRRTGAREREATLSSSSRSLPSAPRTERGSDRRRDGASR